MTKTYNDIDAVTRLLEEVILSLFQRANPVNVGNHLIRVIDLILARTFVYSVVVPSSFLVSWLRLVALKTRRYIKCR